jgi:hypothetical protein
MKKEKCKTCGKKYDSTYRCLKCNPRLTKKQIEEMGRPNISKLKLKELFNKLNTWNIPEELERTDNEYITNQIVEKVKIELKKEFCRGANSVIKFLLN